MFLTDVNCFVNFHWWRPDIITKNQNNIVVISSDFEPRELEKKTLYVMLADGTLVPFTLNSNESVYDIFKYLEKSPGSIPLLYINNTPYFPNALVSEVPYNGIFTLS